LTDEARDELRRKAEAVTPHAGESWGTYGVYANMAYARAASPKAVLELLDRVAALEKESLSNVSEVCEHLSGVVIPSWPCELNAGHGGDHSAMYGGVTWKQAFAETKFLRLSGKQAERIIELGGRIVEGFGVFDRILTPEEISSYDELVNK
jgi:hypothetical protein